MRFEDLIRPRLFDDDVEVILGRDTNTHVAFETARYLSCQGNETTRCFMYRVFVNYVLCFMQSYLPTRHPRVYHFHYQKSKWMNRSSSKRMRDDSSSPRGSIFDYLGVE